MTQDERIEKRFKELRNWLLELQAEDKDADRDDEHDSHNLGIINLHEIKLCFFALVQERDRLRLKLEMWQDGNIMAESHRDELVRNADEFRETLTELRQRVETLTAERDEARQEICLLRSSSTNATEKISAEMEDYARSRGWDCFEEVKK